VTNMININIFSCLVVRVVEQNCLLKKEDYGFENWRKTNNLSSYRLWRRSRHRFIKASNGFSIKSYYFSHWCRSISQKTGQLLSAWCMGGEDWGLWKQSASINNLHPHFTTIIIATSHACKMHLIIFNLT
jgi:hypothetical protein